MPCLQSKKKELDEKRKQEKEAAEKAANVESEKKHHVKKIASISKPVVHTKKNGVPVRDVATQIKYNGDGMTLSLMEIDILNHTGCKWSKILYPGYKGSYIRPSFSNLTSPNN